MLDAKRGDHILFFWQRRALRSVLSNSRKNQFVGLPDSHQSVRHRTKYTVRKAVADYELFCHADALDAAVKLLNARRGTTYLLRSGERRRLRQVARDSFLHEIANANRQADSYLLDWDRDSLRHMPPTFMPRLKRLIEMDLQLGKKDPKARHVAANRDIGRHRYEMLEQRLKKLGLHELLGPTPARKKKAKGPKGQGANRLVGPLTSETPLGGRLSGVDQALEGGKPSPKGRLGADRSADPKIHARF